jgi:hypothetical protein
MCFSVTAAGKHPGSWTGEVAEKLGRSLEKEEPELFRMVVRLASPRNELAHRGVAPGLDEVLDAVRNARRLFRWLESW